MPAQERLSEIDGRSLGGDPSLRQRRHQEAMATNTSPPVSGSRADAQVSHWDDAHWDQEHDEAACHRARRLLARSNSSFHRFGDRIGALRRWVGRDRWVKRLAISIAILMVIFASCFGGLWWRLGAGPINLEMVTPWLAAAIEENIGHGNTVEVGGTQIERAGRIRIAVRIRDIIVRDREHAIVASAPKAEVKLSGMALLMGRLRAESLNLVDAELAVRITPDGRVTVSAGDTAKPLATGVVSKKRGGHRSQLSASRGRRNARDGRGLRIRRSGRRRNDGSRQCVERATRRPRLARQPQPHRTGRTEPQRNRPEKRQPGR